MKINSKIKYIFVVFVIFVIVSSVLLSIFKYSKSLYVKSSKKDYNYTSSDIYISSDLLDYNSPRSVTDFSLYSYDGSPISFHVYNYESDTQISKHNIEYYIDCVPDSNDVICEIDGGGDISSSGTVLDNQVINKSYTCSIAGLSEEQCKNNPNATITYNKVQKTHTITLKPASGNVLTGSLSISIKVEKPYCKELYSYIRFGFAEDEQGLVIKTVKSYTNKCIYRITNYTDKQYTVSLSGTNRFAPNNSSSFRTSLHKYDYLDEVTVYRTDPSVSCDSIISSQVINN